MQTKTWHTPTAGAPYSDKEAWLNQRFTGITATEVRELAKGYSKQRRELFVTKLNRTSVNLDGNRYIDHGNKREPIIGAWLLENFDIEPCELVFSGVDPRHLASPDGLSLNFEHDRVTTEIKTSKHDLTPGEISGGTLVLEKRPDGSFGLDQARHFASTGYYDQMQWQMHVMGGERVLFVWEQHDDAWPDPSPLHDRPLWAWVLRDEQRISQLVEIADAFLAELDAKRVSTIAPVAPEGIDPDVADLVHRLLVHRDAEAVAKQQKEDVWAKLQTRLMPTQSGADDVTHKLDEATVTVSTTVKELDVFVLDEAALAAAAEKELAAVERARATLARAEAALQLKREKFTTLTKESTSSTRLTITATKKEISR